MNFRNLHQQDKPLLLCNVWDVASVKAAEQSGFAAVGTSSAAIASLLGYPDGEAMPFAQLQYIIQRMLANTQLPLSVDLEAGYSRNPQVIANHILQLAEEGIQGINLEDSIVEGQRTLLPAEVFAEIIETVKDQLNKQGVELFLNIRTDTFLLGHPDPVAETKRRIQCYENAGADGIFVPCMVQATAIKAIVASTTLPINVMGMPDLPDFAVLQELGVKRISMGNFPFVAMYRFLEEALAAVKIQQSFKPIFA